METRIKFFSMISVCTILIDVFLPWTAQNWKQKLKKSKSRCSRYQEDLCTGQSNASLLDLKALQRVTYALISQFDHCNVLCMKLLLKTFQLIQKMFQLIQNAAMVGTSLNAQCSTGCSYISMCNISYHL